MESVSIKDLEVDIVNKKSYKAADMRFRLWWRKWLDEAGLYPVKRLPRWKPSTIG
jgi:hypothetical protein